MSAVSYNVTQTAFSDFSPEERDCYTNQEFQPLHLNRTGGYRYDMINCLYSSLIEAILSNCECSPLIWKSKTLKPCRGHQIQCVQKYMENFGDKQSGLDRVKNLITGENATCLQACEFQ